MMYKYIIGIIFLFTIGCNTTQSSSDEINGIELPTGWEESVSATCTAYVNKDLPVEIHENTTLRAANFMVRDRISKSFLNFPLADGETIESYNDSLMLYELDSILRHYTTFPNTTWFNDSSVSMTGFISSIEIVPIVPDSLWP